MMFPIPQHRRPVVTTHGGWDVKGTVDWKGKMVWECSRVVTLTGAAQTVTLNFPIPGAIQDGIQLQAVSLDYSDTTAKDADVRMFSGVDATQYRLLDSVTTSAARNNNVFIQDLRFTKPQKLDFVFANTTNGKTVTLTVLVEEI